MANNSTNINKTKERFDIGGIVDHHCLSFLCFVDIGGIVDHHCLTFLLFC
jgi:hypothetical protein